MLRVKQNTNCLFTQINLHKFFTPKRLHCTVFLSWISLIVIGTFLIGLSTNLFTKQFTYCTQTQPFCSRQFTLSDHKELLFYVVIQNFHQNNRMQICHKKRFLDSFSPLQFQGNIHNNYHCQNYDTYESLSLDSNAGGYRVNPTANAHPCGKVMTSIFNDAMYLITSEGGVPTLDTQPLASTYNLENKFINLETYQLRQWVDIESSSFINYFTTAFTSTKYVLMGRVSLSADSYQVIIKNNYNTNSVLKKKFLISQVGPLGIRDPVLGFYMFVWGILTLFFHLLLCCRTVKTN